MTDTAVAETATTAAPVKFKFNFFKLIVRDIDAAVAFYKDVFGFEQTATISLPGIEERMLAMPGDSFTLVLYQWTDGRDIDIGTGYGPVGFLTRDLDAAVERALAHGATMKREPFELNGGASRICFVLDPEGHEIEIISYRR